MAKMANVPPVAPKPGAGKSEATADNTNLIYGIGAAVGIVVTYAFYKGVRSLGAKKTRQGTPKASKAAPAVTKVTGSRTSTKEGDSALMSPGKQSPQAPASPLMGPGKQSPQAPASPKLDSPLMSPGDQSPQAPANAKLAASEVKERIRQASDEQGKMEGPKRSADVRVPYPPKTTPRIAGAPQTPPSEQARVVTTISPPNLEAADSSDYGASSRATRLRQQSVKLITIAPNRTRGARGGRARGGRATPPTPPSTPAQGSVLHRGRLRSPDDTKSPPSPASSGLMSPTTLVTPLKSPPKTDTPGTPVELTPVVKATPTPVHETTQPTQQTQQPTQTPQTAPAPQTDLLPGHGSTGQLLKTTTPELTPANKEKSKTPEPKGGSKKRNKNKKKTPEPDDLIVETAKTPGRKRNKGKNRRPSKTPEPKPGKAGPETPSTNGKSTTATPAKDASGKSQAQGVPNTPASPATDTASVASMSESQYSMVTDASLGGTKRRRRRKKRKGNAKAKG